MSDLQAFAYLVSGWLIIGASVVVAALGCCMIAEAIKALK